MHRVKKLLTHLEDKSCSKSSKTSLRSKKVSSFSRSSQNGDDIVIVSAIRTAIGKARRGSFRNTSAVELLAPVLKYVTKDINASIVNDICVGTVLAQGSMRANECRQASFLAGLPKETTIRTVNRQCSSGLQAIADIAASIKAGYIEVGIAAGVETMSHNSMTNRNIVVSDDIKQCEEALNCFLPMGITSETVAERFGVTRQQQDELAVLSHRRALAAREKYRQEILPVTTTVKDKKTGKTRTITVRDDDGVRANTSMEGLAKLRTVFKKDGTTTAGNSSQVSDGAAAVLMMRRSKAKELGLRVLGKFTHFAVSGVPPDVMGIGPAFAIPKVLEMADLKTTDIDLYEINEAFASQAVYCVKKLGLTMDNVNVNGGAIAFGHPLGCTGTRMAVTLLSEMSRRGSKRGIVSMCIGSGMGAAGIFERD